MQSVVGGTQTIWGILPAIYLFLGGVAGGTACVSSVARFVRGDAAHEGGFASIVASWVAFIALAGGLLCLVGDLDNPERVVFFWRSFSNGTSIMAIGAWLLAGACVTFLLNAVLTTPFLRYSLGEVWAPLARLTVPLTWLTTVLGCLLGFSVAAYTGFLLSAAGSVTPWSSPFVPVLFVVSALTAGITIMRLLHLIAATLVSRADPCAFDGDVRGDWDPCEPAGDALSRDFASEQTYAAILPCASVIEAVFLGVFIWTLSVGGPGPASVYAEFVTSRFAVWFWVVLVGVGIVVPLVCDLIGACAMRLGLSRMAPVVVATVGTLVGGFALRYLILSSGVHVALVGLA